MEECGKLPAAHVAAEGYLVAKMVRTGKAQTMKLPPAVDPDNANMTDLAIIRAKEVKTVAKQRLKFAESLKKGYATVYNQCSQEVRDKLETTSNWETTQRNQLLHKLISKIERICLGFEDHKQEVFNLVQDLKMLFLYSQSKKESIEEYGCNFKSPWDMVEAFGGSPGMHKGLILVVLKQVGAAVDPDKTTTAKRKRAEQEVGEAVKAALIISGANKQKYGKQKDERANNYLLGSDQYPDTYNKALHILGNYQVSMPRPFGGRARNESGVAFLQQGGWAGRGHGSGRGDAAAR